jgi:signal peptidase I
MGWRLRLLPLGRLTAAAGLLLASPLLLALHRRYFRVEVAGESMAPALQPGDYVIVRRGPPPEGERAFGHVVALRDASGRMLLKRIVGLPGEALRVGQAVQVSGRALIEPYAHGRTSQEQYRGLNRLGEREYFLLGDHRSASTDSRDFGPVTREAIEGVAVFRYWPPERLGRLAVPNRELAGAAVAGWESLPSGIVGASRRRTAAESPRGEAEQE